LVQKIRKLGLLAISQPVVRLGLADALARVQPEWSLVHAETMAEAVEKLAAAQIDFMVVCFRLPGLGGGWGLRRLRGLRPATPVAVLLPAEDPNTVAACRGVGVHGCIGLENPFERVVQAVVVVGSGGLYDPPGVAPPPAAADPAAGLTPHQREVLRLVAEGLGTTAIARRLGLGVGTVKAHLARAYATLGVRSRLQAIVKLGSNGKPDGEKDDG
jgi:DNA-binding NarL/FixJ family response regulator